MSETLLAQQAALLAALWSPATAVPSGEAGLPAYQRNARAVAERALAAAYPVLRQCVGEATLAALARDHWLDCPPLRGDLACWGADLPDWLGRLGPEHELPAWLPELARAEWVLHQLATAPDPLPEPGTLARLVQEDPDQLRLELSAGTQVLAFEAAVISVLLAHGPGDGGAEPAAQALQAAGQRLQAGEAERAVFWRQGWRPRVRLIDAAEAAWLQALHTQPSLGAAMQWLEVHHPGLDLGAWLQEAVTQGLVLAVRDAIAH
ncbi:DUF2063 domain-containing protein [Curvibacter gracilis]|uniref:DUF2063 domain-containing protein n=1 Tax=Curvibacter gracilis TaxID=230310 RepID=UPI00048946B1|nr:DUF2063 domain-containing protein [Curvibacter gracilis]